MSGVSSKPLANEIAAKRGTAANELAASLTRPV